MARGPAVLKMTSINEYREWGRSIGTDAMRAGQDPCETIRSTRLCLCRHQSLELIFTPSHNIKT